MIYFIDVWGDEFPGSAVPVIQTRRQPRSATNVGSRRTRRDRRWPRVAVTEEMQIECSPETAFDLLANVR